VIQSVGIRGHGFGIRGHGFAELWTPSIHRSSRLILKQYVEFENLVTEVGDEYYGERAAGIASPPDQVTGMQLGTGTTAVAKTGAGAAIVTLVASSLVAIDGGFPTSTKPGSARRIQWKTTWPAGTATADDIAEVALVNQSTGTQTVAPAAATISRALLAPLVDKAAGDSLAVTWNHDLLGASS
jgi:hypothetical protein